MSNIHQQYEVVFTTKSGKVVLTRCVTIEGYTTKDDIPKMVDLKYGPGTTVQGIQKLS